jgi:hypothetical protein
MPVPTDQTIATRQLVAEWVTKARHTGKMDVYSGKRDTPRYSWLAPLEITLDRPPELATQFCAAGRDISERGVGLLCRHQVPPETHIWLRPVDEGPDSSWAPARVVHCTQTVGGYVIGAVFAFDPEKD